MSKKAKIHQMKKPDPAIKLPDEVADLLEFLKDRREAIIRIPTTHVEVIESFAKHTGLSFDDQLAVMLHDALTRWMDALSRTELPREDIN